MIYSVHCIDVPDSAALRDQHRAKHREYLDQWNGKLFFSGPLLDDKDDNKQLGSLFILNVKDKAEAEKFIYNENFYSAGVFAKITIMRMRKGRYNPEIAENF